MENNNGKQLKIGSLLSYAQMALSVIIGLVYTPIMIGKLGQSEYGLYNTVSSIISMLSILNLGFNSSYVRYYSKYKKNNDTESIYKLNGLLLIVFIVIGIIALLCGLFLSFNLPLVFDNGLTKKEYDIAKVLMLLLTANLAISFPMSVFTSIITANERYIFLKGLSIIRTVCSPLVNIMILFLGYRSIAMVTVSVSISLVVDVVYFIYVKFILKNRFVFHGFEKGLFRSLFVYTSFIAINMIVDQINNSIDKFLLGRFKGTTSVAIYSVGYTLYQYYMLFSTSVSNVFTPRIHMIIERTAQNREMRRNELTNLFIKVGRVQFLVLGLIASGIVFFGKPFITFWAGVGYSEEAYYVAILLVLPVTIPMMQNIGIEIQRAENKHKFRSIVYLIMAIINLILSIFLCQKYGAIGSAIGTAISFVIANGFIMNVYYQKKCDINVLKFWGNILRMCLGLIVPIIVGICIVEFINLYSMWKLFLFIFIYVIIYCASVWMFSMNLYERNLIKSAFRKVFIKVGRNKSGND